VLASGTIPAEEDLQGIEKARAMLLGGEVWQQSSQS